MIKKGISYGVNTQDNEGRTPLFEAIFWGGNIKNVKTPIENGANLYLKDKNGMTPLKFAQKQEKEIIVEYLLKQGTND